jgi:hypothetical protein
MADGSQKWMMVLPPEGAARQVGEKAWESLCALMPAERRKLFDTKPYLDAFDKLLKQPTDDMVVDLTNQALVVQCLDFAATHVLILALAPITRFTVDLLARQGKITLHWFFEDFREAKYWKDVLPAYTHFLGIQRGPLEAACATAGKRFHYLPTAFILPARAQVRSWAERAEGVAFIGFPSKYRVEVLEAIFKEGLPLKVAGAGWEKYRGPLEACLTGRGWFGPDEAFKLLEASRIGLHLPSEDPRADRDNCHLSPRIFDILAAGCLLLSEEAPLIRETLQGCVYREFRGPAEAVRAIRTALTEGFPSEALAANRDAVLRDHTFARRMTDILSIKD